MGLEKDGKGCKGIGGWEKVIYLNLEGKLLVLKENIIDGGGYG